MSEKYHRLLQNALELLNYVASRQSPATFKEICAASSLPKSTVHNLVQTMAYADYLHQDSDGAYSIGRQCFITGNAYRVTAPAQMMAKKIVQDVAMRCNETTHYAVLDGTDVIYIYKFDSNRTIRVYSQVGKRIPAHTTAIGKALLSGFSDDEVRKLYPSDSLPSLTEHSITSLDVLLSQLGEIRRTHVAYENEESSPQVKCVAVPVIDSKGRSVAGLSLAMPVYRDERDCLQFVEVLLDAKAELEKLYAMYE